MSQNGHTHFKNLAANDVTTWKTNNCNAHIAEYPEKYNHSMKFNRILSKKHFS